MPQRDIILERHGHYPMMFSENFFRLALSDHLKWLRTIPSSDFFGKQDQMEKSRKVVKWGGTFLFHLIFLMGKVFSHHGISLPPGVRNTKLVYVSIEHKCLYVRDSKQKAHIFPSIQQKEYKGFFWHFECKMVEEGKIRMKKKIFLASFVTRK